MRFYPKDHKTARLWVEAFAASLEAQKTVASAVYAQLCGFKNWDALIAQVGKSSPSLTDEHLSDDELSERREFYLDVLTNTFNMRSSVADFVVANLSPSSSSRPKKLSLEHLKVSDENRNLSARDRIIHEIAGRMARQMLGMGDDEMPGNIAEISDQMRLSKRVDPAIYFNFFGNLGWDPVDDSYNADYELDEPAFFLPHPRSRHANETIPVYLAPAAKDPQDHEDHMSDTFRARALASAVNLMAVPELVLCNGTFLSKKLEGREYTCAGSIYTEGQWREFLVGKNLTDASSVFETIDDIGSFNAINPWFEDDNGAAMKLFLICKYDLATYKDLHKSKCIMTEALTGWATPMLLPPGFGEVMGVEDDDEYVKPAPSVE